MFNVWVPAVERNQIDAVIVSPAYKEAFST